MTCRYISDGDEDEEDLDDEGDEEYDEEGGEEDEADGEEGENGVERKLTCSSPTLHPQRSSTGAHWGMAIS